MVHNDHVEAPKMRSLGGMTHISGPLSRIYVELWRKRMCTETTEQLLMKAEEKLEAVVIEMGMPDFFAKWYPLWFVQHYKSEYGQQTCCSDVIVALSDHTERLQAGFDPQW